VRRSNTLRKIGSENLTLGDDHAHKITSRVQNTRTTYFETDFKTLIKKLGKREKIVTQRLGKINTPESHRLTHLHSAHRKHSTFLIVPKSDVLFGHHWGEAGEPPSIYSHVLRAIKVDQPKALHASHLFLGVGARVILVVLLACGAMCHAAKALGGEALAVDVLA
jgi:hypothetical protein